LVISTLTDAQSAIESAQNIQAHLSATGKNKDLVWLDVWAVEYLEAGIRLPLSFTIREFFLGFLRPARTLTPRNWYLVIAALLLFY